MEGQTTAQLVNGDKVSRFLVRRQVESAIKHIDAAMQRLIASEQELALYDRDYEQMVADVITRLFPIRDTLSYLRQTAYKRESCRSAIDENQPLVKACQRKERQACMERIRHYAGGEMIAGEGMQ